MNTRFAIFCRVSTEQQESEGQSLDVQKKILSRCIQMLNGIITKEYIGQEHATENFEKPMLAELIEDCSKGIFDAVMIFDQSRLSRDPIHSKITMAELKKNGIKLFVQTQEYDLSSPETTMFIGIMSEINAFHVNIQNKKALESKLELAKRGWLVVGRQPFGRKLLNNDKSQPAVWGLDDEKLQFAQTVYDLYINKGIHVRKIGRMLNVLPSFLYKLFKDKSVLKQSLNIDGKVYEFEYPIPPIFTQEQYEKIQYRLRMNRTANNKNFQYLLSSLVRCRWCNLVYVGHNTNKGPVYYRHSENGKEKSSECIRLIKTSELDRSVLQTIKKILSHQEILLNAIHKANENTISERKMLEKQIELFEKNKEEAELKKTRIIKAIMNDILTEDEVKKEMTIIREQLEQLSIAIPAAKHKIQALEQEMPTSIADDMQATFQSMVDVLGDIETWPFEAQRKLIEWFFGHNPKNGIIVQKNYDGDMVYLLSTIVGSQAVGKVNDFFVDLQQEKFTDYLKSNPATVIDFQPFINLNTGSLG